MVFWVILCSALEELVAILNRISYEYRNVSCRLAKEKALTKAQRQRQVCLYLFTYILLSINFEHLLRYCLLMSGHSPVCSPITIGVGPRISLSVCLYKVCLGHAHKLQRERGCRLSDRGHYGLGEATGRVIKAGRPRCFRGGGRHQ